MVNPTGPREQPLVGGVANAGAVVRIGEHVLRPSNPQTTTIHRFLTELRSTGFDGASVPVGVDPDGRERLLFIDGDVAVPPFPRWVQSDDALVSIAELLCRFQLVAERISIDGDWSDEMSDPSFGPIVCHNDVCLENVVFRDGVAVGLLDWDFAAPGRAVYDLAQFARMCVPIDDEVSAANLGWEPADRPCRLRSVTDVAGLDRAARQELLVELDRSMETGGEFVRRRVEAGDRNFVAMWEAMGGAERYDRRRRWWADSRASFLAALA